MTSEKWHLGPKELFGLALEREASDIHLKAGQPPLLRIAGAVQPTDLATLGAEEILSLVRALMDERIRRRFEETGSADFAYQMETGDRFRVNVYRQRGYVSLAARRVSRRIPSFQQLHLPEKILQQACDARQGLVIFAGVRGTGKSTSIAACLEQINQTRRCHILTMEDPIEYLFEDKMAFVNQREIGTDAPSFDEALRCLAREDPDVVLVGEVRDKNTCESVLRAAEASRLVFTTVHATSASAVIGRMLEMFPSEDRRLVREILAAHLVLVICQVLVASADPNVPRVPATEILLPTPAVRKMIRDGEEAALPDLMASDKDYGMHDFTQDLARLVREEWVDPKVAYEATPNPETLKMAIRGIAVKQGTMR
ncbi:MAG: PilT/PilU family type 4a pilus ATPase [Planctomycetes bacterium]|nr:PilT/PilU family type 4a pilus ATPase [Planctomycetota bacterium]